MKGWAWVNGILRSRLGAFVLGLVALIAYLHDTHAGLSLGAIVSYGVTTAKTDLNKLWRKEQAAVAVSHQFEVPEWDALDEIPEEQVNWSAREITVPLDLKEETGIASIEEGDYEAVPSSVTIAEGTLTWILLTGAFTISKTARWIDQTNRRAMIANQMQHQGKKKLQALMRRIGIYCYGFSTGIMAKVVSDSGTVITIKDMYGVAGLGSTTTPYRVTDLFRIGDRIAVIDPGGPTIRGFTTLTAVTAATPSLTSAASPGGTALNDLIVHAASLKNDATTLTSSDYNKALVGWLDMTTSSSVHGLAASAEPNWAAGYNSSVSERLNGSILRAMRQGIQNNGGGDLTDLWLSQRVENDSIALHRAGVRYSDAMGLEMDGKLKFGDLKFHSTRFVPPGYAFGEDRKSRKKMMLIPKPGKPMWDDAQKLQDLSGFKLTIDLPTALVTDNRGNLAVHSNLTES